MEKVIRKDLSKEVGKARKREWVDRQREEEKDSADARKDKGQLSQWVRRNERSGKGKKILLSGNVCYENIEFDTNLNIAYRIFSN